MKKLTPNQKVQIEKIISDGLELKDSMKFLNFFSLKYKKSRPKNKKLFEKTRRDFFLNLKKMPNRETFVKLFKQNRYDELVQENFIIEYPLHNKIIIRPTFSALQLVFPEYWDAFLDFLDEQFDHIMNQMLKEGDLSPLQLAIFFLFVLNGNIGREFALNLDTRDYEEDEILKPWLLEFTEELSQNIVKKDMNIYDRHLKEHFRTQISLINNRIGFPILIGKKRFHYYLTPELSDFTVDKIKAQLAQYDLEAFQNLLSQCFTKLIKLKGKMELFLIKSSYDPLKIVEILAKFNLKLTSTS